MIKATLRSVDPSHWDAILNAWSAVASKKATASTAEEKVAAVVSASGEAGFTVEQTAAAAVESGLAAAKKEAMGATTASPLKMVGQALQGAALAPEGKAKVADAAARERPENQEAIAHVLQAAGVMATTTMLPVVDVSDPDARLILNAVAEKLEHAPVDPEEKVKIANAAAEAYMKRMASTTSVDGLGMVVRAAESAGLKFAQVKKMAEAAEKLTVAEQMAAATAIRAANEGMDVFGTDDPTEKVAAVVKAAAQAGVPETEQAKVASVAVTAAARKAKKVKLAKKEGEIFSRIVSAALKVGLNEDQADAILDAVSSMSPDEQEVIEQYLISLMSPVTTRMTTATSTTTAIATSSAIAAGPAGVGAAGVADAPGVDAPSVAAFMFHVVPSSTSRASYKAETGLSAKGFTFGVSLDVQGLVDFLQSKTGKELDPFELSLAHGSFLFTWPSSDSCSEAESGFTDFQSLTFYNATFSNPGQCGDLLAETVDLDAVLRFPSEGDTDLFHLAGMFGSQYEDGGGDQVNLRIVDLLVFQIFPSGEKVEYRVCGDSTGASYLGCPTTSLLKIKYPENSLGQGVKICSGQSHFHEYKLENCFQV